MKNLNPRNMDFPKKGPKETIKLAKGQQKN